MLNNVLQPGAISTIDNSKPKSPRHIAGADMSHKLELENEFEFYEGG